MDASRFDCGLVCFGAENGEQLESGGDAEVRGL